MSSLDPKPVAWRWRQPGNKHWIYDPTPAWIEDHKHEIELEALYLGAAQAVKVPPVDRYNEAMAAIDACLGVSSWQPIETAPKDGTEIIGMFHRQYDETSKPAIYGPWTIAYDGRKWRSSWDEQEVISYMSDFGTEYKGPDIDPTHWQPLPDTSSVPSADCGGGK